MTVDSTLQRDKINMVSVHAAPDLMRSRYAPLDGFRAAMVIGVVVYHLWGRHWTLDPGSTGVIGFFALSGFLITSLLIEEKEKFGRIDILFFYARRALRLLPALFFLLVVWLAVAMVFGHEQWLTTVPSNVNPGSSMPHSTAFEAVGVAVVYFTNWMNALPSLQNLWFSYSPLSHLWTLAVEEQFYLVWAPAMVVLTRLKRRTAAIITAVLALAFLIEPIVLAHSEFNRLYFGTDTRSGALFCGALCAWLARLGAWKWLRTWRGAPWFGATLLAILVVSISDLHRINYRHTWLTGLILASVGGALAVVYLVERSDGAAARLLSTPVMVALGRRSYAIYLWSYVLNTWLRDTGFLEPFLVVGTTLLAAEISFRLIEQPALRQKGRFAPGRFTNPELVSAKVGL